MDELRLTDADRDVAAERMRAAFAEGRLDDAELSDRLETIYSAKTESDLTPVYAGLPVPRPPDPPAEPEPGLLAAALPALSPFLFAAGICTVIWAVTGQGYFWPIWVYIGVAFPVFSILVGMSQHRQRRR